MAIQIESYAALCTSHLSHETAMVIDPDDHNTADWRQYVNVIMHGQYGWLIWIPDPAEYKGEEGDMPEDLIACFDLAREAGMERILFDADVQAIEELPTYEW